MTSKEYIEQQIAAGYDIHFHDEVWWIKASPFFYKPVNPSQVLEIGQSRPKPYKSFLGYSHLVKDRQNANKIWSIMVLDHEGIKKFGFSSVPSRKRNIIRKGLRMTEVKKIEDIESVIDDIKEIIISTHNRTGYGKSSKYFSKNYKKWRASLIRQFNSTQKERWGAFYDGTLIAFMNIVQIDNTVFIDNAASHTDHLKKYPNDTLQFNILEYCRDLKDCQKVVHGDWSTVESLNRFKQSYGFKRVDLPVYAQYSILGSFAKKIYQFWGL